MPATGSMGVCEFAKETTVVLREKTKVVDPVLEVGDSFHSHAERETGVLL